MAPSITISSWTYERTESTKTHHTADHADATVFDNSKTEVLEAFFAIAEPVAFATGLHSPTTLDPKTLMVRLVSTNGGRWSVDYGSVFMTGHNVTKNGKRGAASQAGWADMPGWGRGFVDVDGDGRSDVLDWARSEYAR